MRIRVWLLSCLALLSLVIAGCGDSGNTGDDTTGDGGTGDGGTDAEVCTGIGCVGGIDAPPFGGTCTAGGPQCSNCVDDDGDGDIDGFDIECSGSLDNDENSFSTGIPGDNIDTVMQDCFFDGNSGAGNDGCNIHVCCILGATSKSECPIGANRFEVSECPPPLGTTPLSQKCIDTCGKLAPPGCDCFGCCTICDPANPANCYTINTNPTTSPGCNETTLSDPAICKTCVKNTMCGNEECNITDPTSCILCPGQDPSSLPASCMGTATCPPGTTVCDAANPAGACPANTFCSNGCCIGVIL